MNSQLLAQTNAAFRFIVDVGGVKAAFTECTLPVMELETEEIKEGGLNDTLRIVPGRRKSARITLKNGVGKSDIVAWCSKTMGGKFERKKITVTLQDVEKQTVAVWNIEDAYPTKWTGPQLKADANSIAIQTLELACGAVTVVC